jgi:hypothetical protein
MSMGSFMLPYSRKEIIMPKGKGTYGSKRGRPPKKKKMKSVKKKSSSRSSKKAY